MTAACRSAGIQVEACSDIFKAIEKGKSRAFSCVIADWADQPEAGFLLKRARESALNRETVAIAIVDYEPASAEMHDHHLDFLIYRPIADAEAHAVLAKACDQMKPLGVADLADSANDNAGTSDSSAASARPATSAQSQDQPDSSGRSDHSETGNPSAENSDAEPEGASDEGVFQAHHPSIGLREVSAAALVLLAGFLLWKSGAVIQYLAHTPEGPGHVLRESVAALFYANKAGALPVGTAGSDSQQDAYFSRGPVTSDAQPPTLAVAATESTAETRLPLPKAPDFPLPVPLFEPPAPVPVHVARAAIPESMRNSPPIAPPVVVAVNPAQMMPVSAPQTQPFIQQASSEPIAMSEDAARARLIHTVDPVYPPEATAQKLHGPVVLQALIARDGSVEDLKIVRGYFVLGRAAIAAVKQWRFQPYSSGGHAASTQTMITISFTSPG